MTRLDEAEIAAGLVRIPGWQRHGESIRRRYTLPGFREALGFVNRVAELAEAADHHPDILIEYRNVTLTLSTHDAGGLTERDLALAARIDA